jgi:secondary thiamine-phosphate synthase enzyme
LGYWLTYITASVFINDDESGLHADYEAWLEELAPHEPTSRYCHNRTGEDNGDAHLKRQVMGREVIVAVTAGRLDFGPWEQIFYGEFDGGRRKRVLVKIIGKWMTLGVVPGGTTTRLRTYPKIVLLNVSGGPSPPATLVQPEYMVFLYSGAASVSPRSIGT